MSTTAWQTIASPRPTGPTCSPVLALTFTAASSSRSSRARLARMAGLCGPSLGSWAWMIDVAVDRPPPGLLDPVDDLRQQPGAVQPLPLRIGVGIVLADIAQAGGPQQGVGHRVADDVGVGVPDQSPRMLDPEPAQDQRSPLAQPMRVVPDPYPHVEAPSAVEGPLLDRVPYQPSSEDRSVFSAAMAIPAERACHRFPLCESTFCHFEKKSFKIWQQDHTRTLMTLNPVSKIKINV